MKIRYNTNEFDRDPSIYLGIDGYPIPLSLFVGVKHRPLAMISNTKTPYGVQFIMHNEKDEVLLVSNKANSYVSREDIEDVEEWFFIGEPMEMDYPGIDNKPFKLKLTNKFSKGDLVSGHLIILSTEKLEFGYIHKVATEEDYKHKQFLVKYSNYLRF